MILVDPHHRILWRFPDARDKAHGARLVFDDDTFVEPGGKAIVSNEEDHQTIVSVKPLAPTAWALAVMLLCRFELCQSPLMYGRNIIAASGSISRAPVMYPTHTAGRIPRTLNTQMVTMMSAVNAIGKLK